MVSKPKDEPKTDMSTSDMANEIAKMKNLWRVFERADEVATALQRAEGRKTELDADIKEKETKADAHTRAYEETALSLSKKQETLRNYEQSLDQKLAAAKAKFDADMAALGEHYSQTSVAARDKVAADLKAEQERVDALTAQKSDLQRDKRMLEAEIETLTKRKAEL